MESNWEVTGGGSGARSHNLSITDWLIGCVTEFPNEKIYCSAMVKFQDSWFIAIEKVSVSSVEEGRQLVVMRSASWAHDWILSRQDELMQAIDDLDRLKEQFCLLTEALEPKGDGTA